jgi:hypothetical protein
MRSLLRLELRKQQKVFLGLAMIVVISLSLVIASVSGFAGLPLGETFLSVTVILQAIGIPFFGLLLGGGAGAALRGSDRKAEEDIPIRPVKRVFAAYAVSFFYLMILTFVLLLLSKPMPYAADAQGTFNVPFVMMMLLPLHSGAFVFSYWLSQGLLGSVVSLLATAVPAVWLYLNLHLFSTSLFDLPGVLIWIVAVLFFPFWIFGGTDFILFGVQTIPELVATIFQLTLLIWVVSQIEREIRTWIPTKVLVAILLLSVLSLSIWGFFGTDFL